MKQANVVIGAQYWTRVSGRRVKVIAASMETRRSISGRSQTRVRVRRVDNGTELVKLRLASALHVTPGPWYTETQDERR